MTNQRVIQIKQVNTRALLKMKERCNRGFESIDGEHVYHKRDMFHRYGSDHGGTPVGIIASFDDIISELSTREHIMNKREAKDSRRLASKLSAGKKKGMFRKQSRKRHKYGDG